MAQPHRPHLRAEHLLAQHQPETAAQQAAAARGRYCCGRGLPRESLGLTPERQAPTCSVESSSRANSLGAPGRPGLSLSVLFPCCIYNITSTRAAGAPRRVVLSAIHLSVRRLYRCSRINRHLDLFFFSVSFLPPALPTFFTPSLLYSFIPSDSTSQTEKRKRQQHNPSPTYHVRHQHDRVIPPRRLDPVEVLPRCQHFRHTRLLETRSGVALRLL